MANRRKIVEKKPTSEEDGSGTNGIIDNSINNINSITKTPINQEVYEFSDDDEGYEFSDDEKARHFWYVVYPSEDYFRTHYPDSDYDGSSGWGTAPDDWVTQLESTGLAFQVSEIHCNDENPDGKHKKPHWHVIVSWNNSTTYRSARGLCDMLKCPKPKLLRNVMGAYRYHRHLDNPEKYQYKTYGTYHNGWKAPLDNNDVTRIKRELRDIVLCEDVREYAELLIVCEDKGQDYVDVVINNTIYCERLCASYRHNPIRVLSRYFNTLDEGDTKDMILGRINGFYGKD